MTCGRLGDIEDNILVWQNKFQTIQGMLITMYDVTRYYRRILKVCHYLLNFLFWAEFVILGCIFCRVIYNIFYPFASFPGSGTPVLRKSTGPNRIALHIKWFGWKGGSHFENRFHLRAQGIQDFCQTSENRSGEKRRLKSQL